jgi:hypothetical protein
MPPEENGSASNLILLCLFHSRVIDDHFERYSVETIQMWKASQIGDAGGTPITDVEAEQILALSIRSEVLLQAEIINVGGQSGGGGGAIGYGATGGPGGDTMMINLDGLPGASFGEGGGGGGVVAPGSISPPADAIRAREGRGSSDGYDGQPGGDTFFGDPERPLVKASGGSPGLAGLGSRSTTDKLRISTMMLANSVEQREGLLYLLGGGWQNLSILNVPSQCTFLVVLIIEADGVEAGTYSMHLNLSDPGGVERSVVSFPVEIIEPGEVVRIPRFVLITASVHTFGLWRLAVQSDTSTLANLSLAVRRTTDT